MSWLVLIVIFLCLFVCWLLISPLVFELDTREARSTICWVSIGKCSIFFEEEWWLQYQVFFYQKRIKLMDIKKRPQKRT
ncbi:MAG TPA: hypothetical protein VLR49_00160, partial [Ferruginibacter sp.]|nr:hypothetical protein [Ferruginibacter sp.]